MDRIPELDGVTEETPVKIFCKEVEPGDTYPLLVGSIQITATCGCLVWLSRASQNLIAQAPWATTFCTDHMAKQVMEQVLTGEFEGIKTLEGTKEELVTLLGEQEAERKLTDVTFAGQILAEAALKNKERLSKEAQDKGENDG